MVREQLRRGVQVVGLNHRPAVDRSIGETILRAFAGNRPRSADRRSWVHQRRARLAGPMHEGVARLGHGLRIVGHVAAVISDQNSRHRSPPRDQRVRPGYGPSALLAMLWATEDLS